jgi:hypothetical protein
LILLERYELKNLCLILLLLLLLLLLFLLIEGLEIQYKPKRIKLEKRKKIIVKYNNSMNSEEGKSYSNMCITISTIAARK